MHEECERFCVSSAQVKQDRTLVNETGIQQMFFFCCRAYHPRVTPLRVYCRHLNPICATPPAPKIETLNALSSLFFLRFFLSCCSSSQVCVCSGAMPGKSIRGRCRIRTHTRSIRTHVVKRPTHVHNFRLVCAAFLVISSQRSTVCTSVTKSSGVRRRNVSDGDKPLRPGWTLPVLSAKASFKAGNLTHTTRNQMKTGVVDPVPQRGEPCVRSSYWIIRKFRSS